MSLSQPSGAGGEDKTSTEVQSPHSMTLKRKEVEQYSIGTELSEDDVVLMLTMMIPVGVMLVVGGDVFIPTLRGRGRGRGKREAQPRPIS